VVLLWLGDQPAFATCGELRDPQHKLRPDLSGLWAPSNFFQNCMGGFRFINVTLDNTGLASTSRFGHAAARSISFGVKAENDTAQKVPSGCAVLHASTRSRVFYVDPVLGDMNNDGSQTFPWRTLEEVVKAGFIATKHYASPYRPGATLELHNQLGIVRGGDAIYLRSGNHGSIDLYGAVNSDFITIEAESGQTPILNSLSLAGASKWAFKGLTIQNTKTTLVGFLNHSFLGPTDNIIFEGNHLWTQPDIRMWTRQDWVNQGAAIGIDDQASCATIRDNELRNIRRGIVVGGDDALIERNVIDNFGDDAIDITASRITVRGNRISNSHDIGDDNHNDAIQGWTVGGAINRDTVIDGNTIVVSTNQALPLASYMQGISVFDGHWENIQITNNIVVTNAWHGISLYGVRGCRIINNTVVGIDPAVATWIGVFNMKEETGGTPPSDVIVRNNIATRYNLMVPGIVADHNIIATDPRRLFVNFDVVRAQYDLHILPNSRARGAGLADQAPRFDISGRARTSPFDAGAYVWTQVQAPR
jgi:parallel beta-helix repeat protein